MSVLDGLVSGKPSVERVGSKKAFSDEGDTQQLFVERDRDGSRVFEKGRSMSKKI